MLSQTLVLYAVIMINARYSCIKFYFLNLSSSLLDTTKPCEKAAPKRRLSKIGGSHFFKAEWVIVQEIIRNDKDNVQSNCS